MKLYMSPTSPFVRIVRLYAYQLQLESQIEDVVTVVSPAQVNADFAQTNPLIQIPALETDDGRIFSDSTVICEYLASLAKADAFPLSGDARFTEMQNYYLIKGAMDALVQGAYETLKRPEEFQWTTYVEGRISKAKGALKALLENPSELFEARDTLSLTQCAFICLVDYIELRYPVRKLCEDEAIQSFMKSVEGLNGVIATRPA